MINALNLYADSEVRRIEREHPSKTAFYREQWMREGSATAAAEHRAIARWAGDLLVGAGERLRGCSAPKTAGSRQ